MFFKKLAAGVFAASALSCFSAEIPPQFVPGVTGVFPEAKQFIPAQPKTFAVRDASGKELGKLYLETVGDEGRKFGYGGTIEIAILFGTDEKVAGVLLGKNDETPSFLNRVRAAKFLERWNDLKLSEIPAKDVDAVTGATLSSEAIKSGVRKLAESCLGQTASAEADAKAARVEAIQLERRIAALKQIVSGSEVLLKQLRERKEDELALRLVAATEGPEAAAKFAAGEKMMYFNHPRRGGERGKSPLETAVEAYKADQSAEKLAAVKALILADYERMLQSVPAHNKTQEDALKAAEARLAMLKSSLGDGNR